MPKLFPKKHVSYVLIGLLPLLLSSPAFADVKEKGISAAELMRQAGIGAVLAALLGLIVVEFFFKRRISRGTYKWLLFFSLLMLPVIGLLSATTTVMEETKTVQSCASCHIMHPFVDDMQNPHSPSLAARHFQNKWIAEDQCYHCHTSYGIHGTLEGKRDGFRHWLLFVTETWKEPITFKGSYPNSNCLACHGEAPKFKAVDSHRALRNKLTADEVACSSCHGPVHPTPLERQPRVQTSYLSSEEDRKISAKIDFLRSFGPQATSENGALTLVGE